MSNVVKDKTYKKVKEFLQTVTIRNDATSTISSIEWTEPFYGVDLVKVEVKAKGFAGRQSITLVDDGFNSLTSNKFSLAPKESVTFKIIFRLQPFGAYDTINFNGILWLSSGGDNCWKYANVKVRRYAYVSMYAYMYMMRIFLFHHNIFFPHATGQSCRSRGLSLICHHPFPPQSKEKDDLQAPEARIVFLRGKRKIITYVCVCMCVIIFNKKAGGMVDISTDN
jgi:hypothetical protein